MLCLYIVVCLQDEGLTITASQRCVCVCMRGCVGACVHVRMSGCVCVRVCVRACVRASMCNMYLKRLHTYVCYHYAAFIHSASGKISL